MRVQNRNYKGQGGMESIHALKNQYGSTTEHACERGKLHRSQRKVCAKVLLLEASLQAFTTAARKSERGEKPLVGQPCLGPTSDVKSNWKTALN